MKYKHLEEDYTFNTLATNIYSRETEYYHYELDKKMFESMLSTLEEGPYKEQINSRLASTIVEMNKVEAIYNALNAQITDPVKFNEAMVKCKAKNKVE